MTSGLPIEPSAAPFSTAEFFSAFSVRRESARAIRWSLWGLLVIGTLSLTGCKGCLPDPLADRSKKSTDLDELEKKKKEKEKPKEDFEFAPPMVVPGENTESRSFVKPGHWVSVRHQVKANHFDFQADLHTKTTDAQGIPWEIENTPFQVAASRPLQLPKGQVKAVETNYFIPIVKQTDQLSPKSVWMHRELRAARGGRLVKEDVRQGTVPMPSYQYHFVVLSDEPTTLGYIQSLSSVSAPSAGEFESDKRLYYRVYAPVLDRYAPLPPHVLTWTSIAYVLWDDVGPDILTLDQQQALIDWLHFGGQLIVSGGASLEKLRGSFLDPYLPARPGNTIELSAAAVDELNERWSLTDRKTGERRVLPTLPGKPILTTEMTLTEGAQRVPGTGGLLVERRVGAGRVVASGIGLGDSRLLKWGSLDSFFNGAVLRRPRRRFVTTELVPDSLFADFHPMLAQDSRFSTTLRFFSRDISVFSTAAGGTYQAVLAADDLHPSEQLEAQPSRFPARPDGPPRASSSDLHPNSDDEHLRGYGSGWRTSMAAWNDRSGAANAARQALKDSAGISIPNGAFVLKVLAAYLAVIAPLNWLIFKLIGRVEWAWIAAPVIALVGAFAVVRLAQLDIGFARSRTEIGIIEGFGGYPRAHVTRYAALYSSLTTSYDLEFAEDGAHALPFASSDYQRGPHDSTYEVTMRRDKTLRLSGLLVPSNTTGTVHSEQLVDLGGSLELDGSGATGWQLRNNTHLNLRGAGILHRQEDGPIQLAWLGDLQAKSSVPLRFGPAPNNRPHFVEWDRSPETLSYEVQARELLVRLDQDQDGKISRREAAADPQISGEFSRLDQVVNSKQDGQWDRDELLRWCRVSRAGELSLGQLCELASQALRLLPGEFRLIGWTDDNISGATTSPAASQQTARTLVLYHLRSGNWPLPQPDLNLVADVVVVEPESPEPTATPPATPAAAVP